MRLERCQIETVTRQTDQRTSGPVGQTPQRIWTGLRKDTSKRTPAHSASTRLFDFTHLICCSRFLSVDGPAVTVAVLPTVLYSLAGSVNQAAIALSHTVTQRVAPLPAHASWRIEPSVWTYRSHNDPFHPPFELRLIHCDCHCASRLTRHRCSALLCSVHRPQPSRHRSWPSTPTPQAPFHCTTVLHCAAPVHRSDPIRWHSRTSRHPVSA